MESTAGEPTAMEPAESRLKAKVEPIPDLTDFSASDLNLKMNCSTVPAVTESRRKAKVEPIPDLTDFSASDLNLKMNCSTVPAVTEVPPAGHVPKTSTPRHRKVDSENRAFKERWEMDYLFVKTKNKPQCLVCFQILAVCKEYNVKRHYVSQHEFQFSKYTGELRLAVISDLKSKLNSQAPLPEPALNTEKAAIKASFLICEEIVKRKKAFSDGAFIKECAVKMARAFGNEEMAKSFESVSLSHQTVARRISVMDQYITQKVHEAVKNCTYFSIAVDENVDITGTNQLIICIRTVDENFNTSEELLHLTPLQGVAKDEDIYEEVKIALGDYGGLERCISIMTDGCKSTTLKNSVLAALLRRDGFGCLLLHCIVHEEGLVGTLLKMADVMEVVIKVTNLIRDKKCGVTRRRFKALLEELEAASSDLPQNRNLRWLSEGSYLSKFFRFRKDIYLYLVELKSDPFLEMRLCDMDFLCSLAFLTDITQSLNTLNMSLQEREQNINQLFKHISAFKNKLMLLKLNLLRNELIHLNCCSELFYEMKDTGSILDFNRFIPKIEILIENFTARFQEFNELSYSFRLFSSPLTVDIVDADAHYQMELCEVQADVFLASRPESGIPFFKLLPKERYPNLRDLGLKIASMFGSTYICEKAFSDLNHIKSKYRNNISNRTLLQALRLSTTNLKVDVDELLSQPTH
ncbi:general transcription factor II-I repeat domain-containing protein 2B-like [Aquarana catesbeiana]|uniref:general transcription factor II-I repeat domain-containing protein 2B-like n=1 Tax=Aquarana catesbeiana TaxID=8400 RepID=UPI003CC97B60